MDRVLRLDNSGIPTSWLSREQAAVLYIKNLVQWEIGNRSLIILGGTNRLTGKQSSVLVSPVVATQGKVYQRKLVYGLSNRMLFRRDNYRCMYCGGKFNHAELTRDHIKPRAQGGEDIWENVVAACGRCNHFKADRTPEQAGMKLLAIPFRPNIFETMYLAQHKVLDDQMKYLEHQFSGQRDWNRV